jgi:hypothetical protein
VTNWLTPGVELNFKSIGKLSEVLCWCSLKGSAANFGVVCHILTSNLGDKMSEKLNEFHLQHKF